MIHANRIKLGELLAVSSGVLPSRQARETKPTYSSSDFRIDESLQNLTDGSQLLDHPLILDLYQQKAAMWLSWGEDCVVAANFAIAQVKSPNILDPIYFMCWFNESGEAERQIRTFHQGTLTIRLGITDIVDMEITLPALEEQRRLGRIYVLSKRLAFLRDKRQQLQGCLVRHLVNTRLSHMTLEEA